MEISRKLTFRTFSPNANLIVIDGKLTKVSNVKPEYDFLNRCVKYSFTTPDGETGFAGATEPLFESEDNFRRGIAPTSAIKVTELLKRIGIEYEENLTCETIYPYVWIFKDGQPIKDYINFITLSDGKPELADGAYLTRKDCLDDNDYIFVDGNGVEHVRKSLKKHIVLNDKQKEIVERLKSVLKSAEDANVGLAFLADFDEICAFNKSDIVATYNEGFDDEDVFLDVSYLRTNNSFNSGVFIMHYKDVIKFND